MPKYTKSQLEAVKDAFLQNIGKVIRLHRTNKGWTQKDLGHEIGVSYGAINRYETIGADVSAANMAYISVVLDFPLREYIEDYDSFHALGEPNIPMDQVLREILHKIAIEKARKEAKQSIVHSDRPPKPGLAYNTDLNEWEMVPSKTSEQKKEEKRKAQDEFMTNTRYLNIEEEGKFFNEYYDSMPLEKKNLLIIAYNIMQSSEDLQSAMPLFNAIVNYLMNDIDGVKRKRLKTYKKYLEYLENLRIDKLTT